MRLSRTLFTYFPNYLPAFQNHAIQIHFEICSFPELVSPMRWHLLDSIHIGWTLSLDPDRMHWTASKTPYQRVS